MMIMVVRSRRRARWIGHSNNWQFPCVLEVGTSAPHRWMLTVFPLHKSDRLGAVVHRVRGVKSFSLETCTISEPL